MARCGRWEAPSSPGPPAPEAPARGQDETRRGEARRQTSCPPELRPESVLKERAEVRTPGLKGLEKVKTAEALVPIVRAAQAQGRRVVFTNGCFDLLHRGHVRYLTQARAVRDLLVVGLSRDGSVAAFKGPRRPITP